MIEDSVEGFVARWRNHAVRATAFGRAEGSPLLELAIGDAVLQALERTGPYLAPAGPVLAVVHAVTDAFHPADGQERRLEAVGLGGVELVGPVVERDGPLCVVDAGAPVVVALDGAAGATVPDVGTWVACVGAAPVHAFVVPAPRRRADGVPTDELV